MTMRPSNQVVLWLSANRAKVMVDLLMPTAVGKGEWTQSCKLIGTREKCVLSFGELLARLSVLRQLCKISRVKVCFDTENARDSFYRAAVNFVLDDCMQAAKDIGAVKLNGEDPREFAGLASNIGLDKFRVATLVCASIATRTRTCFLQCWALEIQGKRPEALDELVKICRIHYIFPPEDNSAEMEMVAAGLEKNLHVAERVHLLYLYRSACTAGNLKTAAEALGLYYWGDAFAVSQYLIPKALSFNHWTKIVCQMNENTPEGLVMLTFVVRVATPIHQPQMEALKPLTQFWYSYFLNMQYATKTRIKHTADFLLIRFLGTDPHEAPRLMLNHDPFMDF
ncbi:unnamed protein product [Miscanthus lutarioriparius]|uniref:Uncharacterized protein n=1 Tax=Miscanthus lutarioriparius TaxID=422564 RepID=A0A811RW88_9POAL|nr:unnamed protein product [Miscanthus lutarioriparius]